MSLRTYYENYGHTSLYRRAIAFVFPTVSVCYLLFLIFTSDNIHLRIYTKTKESFNNYDGDADIDDTEDNVD